MLWTGENGQRAVIPGSLRTDDLVVRIAEGVSKRGYAMSPGTYLQESLDQLSRSRHTIFLTGGAGFGMLPRLLLSAADEALVLVEPDRHVKVDVDRVRSAARSLKRDSELHLGIDRIKSLWVDDDTHDPQSRERRRARATAARVATALVVHGASATNGPAPKSLVAQLVKLLVRRA